MSEHRRRQKSVTVGGEPLRLRQCGGRSQCDIACHERLEEVVTGCRNVIGLQGSHRADEFERLLDIAAAHSADLEVIGPLGDLVGGFGSAHVASVAASGDTLQSLQSLFIRSRGSYP